MPWVCSLRTASPSGVGTLHCACPGLPVHTTSCTWELDRHDSRIMCGLSCVAAKHYRSCMILPIHRVCSPAIWLPSDRNFAIVIFQPALSSPLHMIVRGLPFMTQPMTVQWCDAMVNLLVVLLASLSHCIGSAASASATRSLVRSLSAT